MMPPKINVREDNCISTCLAAFPAAIPAHTAIRRPDERCKTAEDPH